MYKINIIAVRSFLAWFLMCCACYALEAHCPQVYDAIAEGDMKVVERVWHIMVDWQLWSERLFSCP